MPPVSYYEVEIKPVAASRQLVRKRLIYVQIGRRQNGGLLRIERVVQNQLVYIHQNGD
jgi:hypothetical protein